MRLGEVLALRCSRADLDKKVIQVREAIEETEEHGIRFKAPKSKAGRRDITLPDILANALRDHRKAQLELRMKLGAGRLPNDALLFSDLEGNPFSRNAMSAAWSDFAASIDLPEVTFHALRHTLRCRRRHCDDQQTSRSRETRYHLAHLCPLVQKGRRQGCCRHQFNFGSIGCQMGAKILVLF
jgi:integrase